MKRLLCLAIVCMVAAPASAVVLDGSIAGDGYSLVTTQTVETQFGDNASELNAAWAQVKGGTLYLTLTGNLEANFNKLNLFIDSVAGGENVLTNDTNNGGNNPTNDGWASKYAGFTFDTGFAADYLMIMRNGNGNQFDFDFNSVGSASVVEVSGNIFSGSTQGSNASVGASGIGVAFNNSNSAGVIGGTAAADQAAAQAVETGIELAIPLAAIGNPAVGSVVKITAMVNGSNHDFLSNQFLPGLTPPQGNLGGDGNGSFTGTVGQLNLAQFATDQETFNIVIPRVIPEPTSLVLIGISLVGLACGRGRSS